MVAYAPSQGDIIMVDISPTKGREQKGKRPALVISNEAYYRKTGLIIICPVSNTKNKFPLHLQLNAGIKTTGFILTQHIRTIDPDARPIVFIEKVLPEVIDRVMDMVGLFFI